MRAEGIRIERGMKKFKCTGGGGRVERGHIWGVRFGEDDILLRCGRDQKGWERIWNTEAAKKAENAKTELGVKESHGVIMLTTGAVISAIYIYYSLPASCPDWEADFAEAICAGSFRP